MATTTRQQEYLATLEYILESVDNPKKHYVYPMPAKDHLKVTALFAKVNLKFIIMNYPSQLLDDDGNLVLDEDGEPIVNIEPFEAMQEILEMALHEPWETTEQWISIRQIEEVFAMFQGASGLLKKNRELEAMILSSTSPTFAAP